MLVLRRFKVREQERGLLFKDNEFQRLLAPGRYWMFDLFRKLRVDVVSVRDGWLEHDQLDVIARSGVLEGQAQVLDLADSERALVWFDGRFEGVLVPGLYAVWTVFRRVKVEIVDAREVQVDRPDFRDLLNWEGAPAVFNSVLVEAGHLGLVFKDGELLTRLRPGSYLFWKNVAKVQIQMVDLRERVLDVAGQEIMTADKVTLRLNALVTYRVADAEKAVAEVEDYSQALYREAQLALRGAIGARELDAVLVNKDELAAELERLVAVRSAEFGLEVTGLGIRDVILPGDMKVLLNQVTEAKKAAEAALITRREETAAMRSQANTARILESNPTLMRLRELEVLEKVAEKANLNVVLGEQGLVDRVVKLL